MVDPRTVATSDVMKSYDEIIDDLVEAVDHANACEAAAEKLREENASLALALDEAKRIVGALVARRSEGYRFEREEIEHAPGFAVHWDGDVMALRMRAGT